jgi:serine/threonine-protein phosphatase 5
VKDAETALALDPKFMKAYYRRAVASIALGKLKGTISYNLYNLYHFYFIDAVRDLKQVVKYAPNDKDARLKLTESEKEYKKLEFEKAIAVDEVSKSALEQFGDLDAISVEPSYDGPVLPDTGITLEFVKQMMEHLKVEKKLHKKFALKIMAAVKDMIFSCPSLLL